MTPFFELFASSLSICASRRSPALALLATAGHAAKPFKFLGYGRHQGVVFLAAAGNQPTTANTYPAAYSSVTALTAVNRDGSYASYANRGSFVDVGLPGSDLVPYNNTRYLISGTSTATAFGSGIVAARTQTTGGKPADAVTWLIHSFPPPSKP